MATARVFQSGDSQAIRLSKEFRPTSKEVEIFRRGNELVTRERIPKLRRAFELLTSLPDDFLAERRDDQPAQVRDQLS
jgi:antitoxin VapB